MARLLVVALVALAIIDERTPVPGFFDLPVTGGTATFDMLGLRPDERGPAIAILVRSMFSQGGSAAERAASVRRFITSLTVPGNQAATDAESQPITIAVPLTADHWRDLLPSPANKGDLFAALIADRAVLLTCAGATSTDASIRALLDRDRGLLRWIARTAPAAFWVSGRSLKLDNNRVVVPGGASAEPIWEALAGERVSRPAEFLRALLSKDGGRLAWFYDAVAAMPARHSTIFGQPPIELAIEQTRALYQTFRTADTNWRLEDHPFLRNMTDPFMVTSQVALQQGALAPPNDTRLWELLFDRGAEITRKNATPQPLDSFTRVSLAWLAQRVAAVAAKERRDRYEMVRFAQAVFPRGTPEDSVDIAIALGGYRRYRSLLLSLDRMELTTPRVYSRAVEAARRLDDLSGRDRKHAVIAYQAALAIIERARVTRAIDVPGAERLVLALADIADTERHHAQAITQWMVKSLLDALPPLIRPDQWTGRTAYESRLLQALAGRPTPPDAPVLQWEGLNYRVDHFGAEHERIKRVREQLHSPGLDAALSANNEAQVAEALLVLIYAPALGDPEGPALLGGDIAQRHDFGTEGAAGMRRELLAWSVPREQVGDGNPWHLEGSLLGLDVALARLALRRLSDSEMPVAPTINLNDQLTLSRTVRVLNPYDFTDADRDRIVEAIARGRARVAAAAASLAGLVALANEVALPAAMRETLPWTFTRTPELATAMFGLRELLWLGRADVPAERLNRWGVYSEPLHSRLRTTMPTPAPWDNFGGRADGGVIATQMPDLTLRMAQETARLKLPAQLIPALLTYATQDFWHDVESRYPDDLPAMSRQALALLPQRVEDYVAALAGDGPLRPR